MKETYLEKFEKWLLRAGRIDRDGIPSDGLSPRTALDRTKKIRRILVDLGYIEARALKKRRYEYRFKGDIRNLSAKQIDRWFKEEFPALPNARERYRKSSYVEAVYKFAEFMYYEHRQWSKSKLELLKRTVRRPWTPPPWENKVEILDVQKIDDFLRYLKGISMMHHMMCYLMRYANMRYIEVINARSDLQSGTFREDFKNNRVFIYGKGRGGLTQMRTTPFFEDDQKELSEFLEWRDKKGMKSEWLFLNQYGRQWSGNCDHFNSWLRRWGRNYGLKEREIKLLTTHKIGRHAYGTDATIKGLPEKFIADNMGIRNPRILQRYQNATDTIRIEETRKKLKGCADHRSTSDPPILPKQPTDEERRRMLIDLLIQGKINEETYKIALDSISLSTAL